MLMRTDKTNNTFIIKCIMYNFFIVIPTLLCQTLSNIVNNIMNLCHFQEELPQFPFSERVVHAGADFVILLRVLCVISIRCVEHDVNSLVFL